MKSEAVIEGVAAPLPVSNLDTDQIMPKQFLRGIDKAGLANGVFHDLRFDDKGGLRVDFVLNRPEYLQCRILVAGENFGCGSSREHAVWGLLQYGIRAVVAPSFGEIFYSNAMNNGLLLVAVSRESVDRFLHDAADPTSNTMSIDVGRLLVRSERHLAQFELSARHHAMFVEGVDLLGATLAQRDAIAAFEAAHWAKWPPLKALVPASVAHARLRGVPH